MVALTKGVLMNVCLIDEHRMSELGDSKNTMAPLERELRDFIESAKTQRVARAWLENGDMRVYVRKATRVIEGKKITTLDVASVEVCEELRGHGLFSTFLETAHRINPWDATYIENVQDDRFAEFFWRRDWELMDDVTRCFYKKKNQGEFRDAWTRARTATNTKVSAN